MLGNYSTDEELLVHIYSAVSVYSNYTGQSKCLNIVEQGERENSKHFPEP